MDRKIMKKLVGTLLCTVMLLCMLPLVSHAATTTTHSHPLCGSSCACASDTHTSKSWTAWDGTTKMYNGYYYLTQDIVLESTMILDYSYTSWLCLNGHSITCEDRVFDIYSYRSLLITDCKGTGKVETTGSDCTIGNNKYLGIWGGTILNSGDWVAAIEAYAGTNTLVYGGRVESTTGEAIYAYPGSKIKIEGGTLHGKWGAIGGHDDTSGKLSSLTISGGRITAEQTYNVVEVPNGSLTMTGGYVGGGVVVYDQEGTVSVSGGTIDGELESAWSNETTITGGDMGISLGGNATIHAGTFRGTCYPGPNATITGGNFSACDQISTAKETWICGGSYSKIRVAEGPLYLSGVPSIGSLQVDAPATVSAQSADGSGSFGGDTIALILNTSTDWSDGDIIIKDVTSDAVAAKFALTGVDPRWTYLERSGDNLVLRILPHGTWGSSVNWGFVNGTLTVSGSGAIDYAHSGRQYPWGDYVDEITEIIVEPGITGIPSYAFEYCESVRSITLPETLESLALNAFNDCGSLNNLLLPASITAFGGSNGWDTTFIRCESLTDVYYLGTAEEWGAVHNANNVTSINSQMTIHFLQPYGVPATCTSAGIETYYLFDDTSVYGGMYNAAKQPITQTVVAPALGHRIAVEQTVQVDPLTVENTGAVPFVLTEGTYYSNNHSDNTTSQFQIVAQHACTLTLRYGVSSEMNYDKLYILHNDTQKAMISGSVTDQVLTLELAVGDVVTVRYTKDGNVSSNQDQGWVALEYGMISGLESVDVPAETFEPDCTHAVVCQYCQSVVKEALGHRVVMEQTVQVDPLTVENTDAVPFVLTGGTYYSNNRTHSSSSQLRIVAQYACTLTLRYGVSSEQNFDKLYILHNNTQKDVISGSVAGKTLTLELAAGDVVTVRYTKDSSVSKNQDQGWVTLEYGLVPGLGDVDVRIDTLEPHCTDAIICDYCQAVGKEAVGHQYENYVSNNDATCQKNATETGTCKYGCGTEDTREIADSKAEHEFENYVSNNDATCQKNATETGTCKYGCGETDTRDIADSKLAHQFENYVSNDDATCQSNATETAACERGCGETDTREVADSKAEHEFENYVSNNDATCQSNATETGTCKYGCGTEDTREVADSKAEHEFENYVSNNDATCQSNATETGSCKYGCGETDTREVADSKAEHEFENYVSNNDATCQSNATETGTCKYGCGETNTREIADSKAECEFENYVSNNDATCQNNATETGSCKYGCGETDTREIADSKAECEFENYVSNNDATCQNNATETGTCKYGCGETDTREIADSKAECEFENYVSNNDATCQKNATETGTCKYGCGETDTRDIADSKAEHTPGEWIVDVEPTATTEGSRYKVCTYEDCGIELEREAIPALDGEGKSGLQQDDDGEWRYYVNGAVDTSFTGMVDYYGTLFYVANGTVDWTYVGLGFFNDTWYYISGGIQDGTYTGLAQYYDNWFYVADGVLDWTYTGLVDYYDTQFYVANGVVDWNYVGLGCYDDLWYYVNGGVVDWGYTGLAQYYDNWFYMANGELDWNFTGLVDYCGTQFYVANGVVDWDYVGLGCFNGTWYFVRGGVVDWTYTGLADYWGNWFYVKDGLLDWSYTGFADYYGTEFYVVGGYVDWSFTGTVDGKQVVDGVVVG